MIDQTRQYQEEYEENLILQKKYFFQELLEGSRLFTGSELQAEMTKFKLPELDCSWMVMVVEIDRYPQFAADYHQHDQTLLKFVLIQRAAGKCPAGGEQTYGRNGFPIAGCMRLSGFPKRRCLKRLSSRCSLAIWRRWGNI